MVQVDECRPVWSFGAPSFRVPRINCACLRCPVLGSDLEIQLKTEQVHIAPASGKLASHRTAGEFGSVWLHGRM